LGVVQAYILLRWNSVGPVADVVVSHHAHPCAINAGSERTTGFANPDKRQFSAFMAKRTILGCR